MDISFDTRDGQNMNLDDDETALLDEISIQLPERKAPLKPKPARPSPFAKQAPGPTHREALQDDGMDMFMNPDKRTAPPPPVAEEYDGGEDPEEYEQQEGGGGGGEQIPSEGYKTIEDEKADLLNKISRLNKKGIQSSQRLSIFSDIDEIRTEYKRMTYSIEVERSIKFQRRMLVACVTGLEFLNDKFDPFDVELNGWSQNTMENIEDYDGVFEELYAKYRTKVSVAPEVKLLMMVGGSAMMFHLTNSMFKAAVPNPSQVMKQNPDLMRNMMDAVQRSQNGAGPGAGERPAQGLRPGEMRGPGMDFGSLMNMMGPPQAVNSRPGRQEEDEVSDIVSIDAGGDTRSVPVEGKPRGRKSKKKEVSI